METVLTAGSASPLDTLGPLLFWAVVFLALIHEVIRGARRVLPTKVEGSRFFRAALVFVPLALGAVAIYFFPGAAPGIEGRLLLVWGAFVGMLSAVGHEVVKVLKGAVVKRAAGVLGVAEPAGVETKGGKGD